jgi:hypothetical protein
MNIKAKQQRMCPENVCIALEYNKYSLLFNNALSSAEDNALCNEEW